MSAHSDAIDASATSPDALQSVYEYGSSPSVLRQVAWFSGLPALEPADVVLALLLSDGDPERRNRALALSPNHRFVGIAAGHAPAYGADGHYCVLVLGADWRDS